MEILIGKNIKRLRINKNVTQEHLAEAMNVTCAAVSKWERSESFPDITLLQPLAYYFGVSLDELMGYDENKVEAEIAEIIEKYDSISWTERHAEASDLIKSALKKFPGDHRIMIRYMYCVVDGNADNDPKILLEHKAEFEEMCRKIFDGCTDSQIRLGALNMQAKLLWAEGKTQEALDIYEKNFANWYSTVGQKCEQLFPKDTLEFLYYVRKNMRELVEFAADKLMKSTYFDRSLTLKERVAKAERFCDIMLDAAEKTQEIFFSAMAGAALYRLHNDVKFRGGGSKEDLDRIWTKYKKTESLTGQ